MIELHLLNIAHRSFAILTRHRPRFLLVFLDTNWIETLWTVNPSLRIGDGNHGISRLVKKNCHGSPGIAEPLNRHPEFLGIQGIAVHEFLENKESSSSCCCIAPTGPSV